METGAGNIRIREQLFLCRCLFVCLFACLFALLTICSVGTIAMGCLSSTPADSKPADTDKRPVGNTNNASSNPAAGDNNKDGGDDAPEAVVQTGDVNVDIKVDKDAAATSGGEESYSFWYAPAIVCVV
jgi:hypothetical protein